MFTTRALVGIGLLAASFLLIDSAAGDNYQAIVTGKVTMEDGSAPPFTSGIERVCSDIQGSGPGPIANKKDEFVSTRQVTSAINATSLDPTCWPRLHKS
jgi:hypothetical protein